MVTATVAAVVVPIKGEAWRVRQCPAGVRSRIWAAIGAVESDPPERPSMDRSPSAAGQGRPEGLGHRHAEPAQEFGLIGGEMSTGAVAEQCQMSPAVPVDVQHETNLVADVVRVTKHPPAGTVAQVSGGGLAEHCDGRSAVVGEGE